VKSLLLLLALLALAAVMKFRYLDAYERTDPLARAPYGDSVVYLDEVKRHFRSGEPAVFYKPPAYTLVLAALGGDRPEGWHRVRVLQLLLGLGILACIFGMARARGGSWAGAIAFGLALFYAPLTFHETKLLDTTLALFLVVAACALFDAYLRRPGGALAFLTGILLGLASLSRAANLVLVLAAAAVLLFRREKRDSLVLLGAAALTVLPVSLHNLRASGEFIPVNYSEGHTFLVGNNPNSRGIYSLPPGYSDGVLNERVQEEALARRALGRDPTPAEQRNLSYAEGLRFLAEHPGRVPALLFDKLRFALSPVEISDNYSLPRERKKLGLLTCFVIPFPLVLALGLFGLAAGRLRPAPPVILPLCVTAALLLIFYVTARYRLPLVPFLAVSAGTGLSGLMHRDARPPAWRIKLGAALVILLLILLAATKLPYSKEEIRAAEETFQTFLDFHAARSGG
jgi:4-amino-4-deoxy-L-arabinose transferase-like glycosyltransferase